MSNRPVHFGIVSPPVPGHIHPFGALGRELIARGHRVTFLQMADVEAKVLAEGLEFEAIGMSDHPRGSLPQSLEQLGKLQGLAALRFTIQAVKKTTAMICRDAPAAIRSAGIEMLLVDQTEPAGGTVAEYLGLPFVTVCCALAINRDNAVPPPFTSWRHSAAPWSRMRNAAGYAISRRILSPVTRVLVRQRRVWGLPPHSSEADSFSALAQISQQTADFDFPRRVPSTFHYTGPLRRGGGPEAAFPWEKLDGRPLVYASLGTLQHAKIGLFRAFADACARLPVQLVLAHCGALDENAVAALPGDPIAVHYAPQIAVLRRARLALTHAGLNTALDALACGVPLVALPITYEQPAIAARIEASGAGRTLSLRRATPARLRELIAQILAQPSYAAGAARIAASVAAAGGVVRAADIIENVARERPAAACRSYN